MTSLSSFHIFPNLPVELRRLVWYHAIVPRTIHIEVPDIEEENGNPKIGRLTIYPDQCKPAFQPVPTLLHICAEAREVGLKFYVTHDLPRRFYFAGALDILRVARYIEFGVFDNDDYDDDDDEDDYLPWEEAARREVGHDRGLDSLIRTGGVQIIEFRLLDATWRGAYWSDVERYLVLYLQLKEVRLFPYPGSYLDDPVLGASAVQYLDHVWEKGAIPPCQDCRVPSHWLKDGDGKTVLTDEQKLRLLRDMKRMQAAIDMFDGDMWDGNDTGGGDDMQEREVKPIACQKEKILHILEFAVNMRKRDVKVVWLGCNEEPEQESANEM